MALLGSGETFKRCSQASGLWGSSLQEEDCKDNDLPLSLSKAWLWSRQFCSVILSWYGALSQNRLQSNKVRQSWVVTSEMWVKKKNKIFSIYKLRISVFLWWWKAKPLFQLLKFSQQFFPCLVWHHDCNATPIFASFSFLWRCDHLHSLEYRLVEGTSLSLSPDT